jgi:diol dehydratase reactivase alpha subunit
VTGCRTAIVVRTAPVAGGDVDGSPALASGADGGDPGASVILVGADGAERPLDERLDPPPPGSIAEIRGALGGHGNLLDVVWRPLPAAPEDTSFSRRLMRKRAVAIALLARGDSGDLVAAVSELCAKGARVIAPETEAAMLGAASTPGAVASPFVLDLGGGTVDLHCAAGAVSTAGAGDLVTRICASLLGSEVGLAERAKRYRSARVETPFTLHHEDGSRSFLGEPAPPETLARLCMVGPKALEALPAPLAPEVWSRLRRAAKRQVLGFNVRRALDGVGPLRLGELVLLIGGCAADPEVLDIVAGELDGRDLAVARGNVLGRHGPRAAVAAGLVLAFAGSR